MKKFLLTLLATAIAAAPFAVAAQELTEVKISTGGEQGSYHRFIKEVKLACANVVTVTPVVSIGGTPMTLDRLENNELPGGVVQMDVADLYKATRDVSNLRVLVPLFPEQVHILTLANSGKKEGGGVNLPGIGNIGGRFGAKDVVLNDVTNLAGRTVYASGGSYYTAQVLSHPTLGGLAVQLKDSGSSKATVDAVLTGQADAGILVGAQPLDDIAKRGEDVLSKLKILPVTDDFASKVRMVYSKGQPVTYRQMGQGGTSVPALQVMSALVVQNYTKGPFVEAFVALRKCIQEQAPEMSSKPGTHPAWRKIREGQSSSWASWEAPAGQTPKSGPAKKLK